MIDYIMKWWRVYKERGKIAEIERLKATFRIQEKNGALWIMHHDTAIDMVPPFASSEEVVQILDEARCCAVDYAYGVCSESKNECKQQTLDELINER